MPFTRSFRLWLCFLTLSPFSIVSQAQSPAISRIIKLNQDLLRLDCIKNV
ncbi:hypothetical protein Hanom_Chr08g00705541 [Helianthus anomalus]